MKNKKGRRLAAAERHGWHIPQLLYNKMEVCRRCLEGIQ